MHTISTSHAPCAIGPYVQAKIFTDFIFMSGQIPLNPITMKIQGITVKEQTIQVIENILAILRSVNLTLTHIIKTTCYLTTMEHFSEFNEAYSSYFLSNPPARSCVAVKELPKKVLVEIEAIAVKN